MDETQTEIDPVARLSMADMRVADSVEQEITLDSLIGPWGEKARCEECGKPSNGWRYCEPCDEAVS